MTAVLPVDRLRAVVDQITTLEDARDLRDRAEALRVYARQAGLGLQAQNECAAVKLRAERRAGEILAKSLTLGRKRSHDATVSLDELGITKSASSRWQRMASVSENVFEQWLADTFAAGKEITQQAAIKLAPTSPREERANIANQYVAPPIDVEIAREFGMEVSDELAELIARSIRTALRRMENPRHAYVWARYHGINDDGTLGDAWAFDGISKQMGTSREYIEGLYYRASHHVRGQLVIDLLSYLRRQQT